MCFLFFFFFCWILLGVSHGQRVVGCELYFLPFFLLSLESLSQWFIAPLYWHNDSVIQLKQFHTGEKKTKQQCTTATTTTTKRKTNMQNAIISMNFNGWNFELNSMRSSIVLVRTRAISTLYINVGCNANPAKLQISQLFLVCCFHYYYRKLIWMSYKTFQLNKYHTPYSIR